MDGRAPLLRRTADLAIDYMSGLADRPVGRPVDLAALRSSLDVPLPARPMDPETVIADLAAGVAPGLVASAGPRYFGFVVGGGVPAALAADWLTSAWDQNAGLYALSPAAAVAEEIAGKWLIDLFGLPAGSSVGFVTGATMATFTALAAARHAVLERAGWSVEDDGLIGAPPISVVVGDEAHVTVFASLQMIGLGRARVHRVAADAQGRMRLGALRETLAKIDGPTIVAAQAGNVNTGAFDPLESIADAVSGRPNAWLHVDGAFGLWAAAVPELRDRVTGLAGADSWTTDAHKWLNVPYDSGIVITRHAAAHHAAMTLGASYYVETTGGERDPYNWVPESSRRARGFTIYAALRSLGRDGLADLIARCCGHARRMADALREAEGVTILNDVVLNQVLVRFAPRDNATSAEIDEFTRKVILAVQQDGTCWLGGTTWRGMGAMRVSVSNWSTTDADIDVSAKAILRCRAAVAAEAIPA
ncbi:MAG TPA: aminotransferase class V-fold PLP-dependent enzyme [Candidatus Limnocylindrales bacterium]|nr:aminotransferase class V-fold PLP-dependent enzyme [Candidatus Limnocylindrales bacterium]